MTPAKGDGFDVGYHGPYICGICHGTGRIPSPGVEEHCENGLRVGDEVAHNYDIRTIGEFYDQPKEAGAQYSGPLMSLENSSGYVNHDYSPERWRKVGTVAPPPAAEAENTAMRAAVQRRYEQFMAQAEQCSEPMRGCYLYAAACVRTISTPPPAVEAFPVVAARVAASLPTDPDDEALVDAAARREVKVRPMAEASPDGGFNDLAEEQACERELVARAEKETRPEGEAFVVGNEPGRMRQERDHYRDKLRALEADLETQRELYRVAAKEREAAIEDAALAVAEVALLKDACRDWEQANRAAEEDDAAAMKAQLAAALALPAKWCRVADEPTAVRQNPQAAQMKGFENGLRYSAAELESVLAGGATPAAPVPGKEPG